MADLQGFNADEVEPSNDFDPIPAGKYTAVITESDTKENKAKTGSYLELTFEIIEGEFKGRKVWSRLNMANPNPLAVKIARADLAAICKAVGVMAPGDSCALHDLPLEIRVKQKTDSEGEVRNEIKGYKPKPSVAAVSTQPQQAANATPPWRR